MTQWMPIESAPKDGSETLLFQMLPHGEPMYRVGYWETDGENVHSGKREAGWSEADDGYTGCFSPTHWMPLPPAPEGE